MKTLLDRVAQRHGFSLSAKKMYHARNHRVGATLQQAEHDLLSLGALCEAFVLKNPGSIIRIEKSDTNELKRIFICPGEHA